MSAGYPQTKADIDNRAGSVAIGLREAFRQVQLFKAYLENPATTDAYLTSIGYSPEEIATLRNAYGDLDALRLTATGQRTQPSASDFFFAAKNLYGTQ